MMVKKDVIDADDLKELSPWFGTFIGRFLGKLAIKLSGLAKVNQVHRNSCHLRGAAFTTSLLRDPLIDLKYNLHNAEILEHLPEGSFVTVSNHPIGSLDGIMLIDVVASRRPDFKVMVNGILSKIGAMKDNFISVHPDTDHHGGNLANMYGVRQCLQQIKEGHPVGFFPAGAMSFYDKKKKKVCDLPWTRSIIRLIHKSNVPVYPIYFDFNNSKFFYWLGNISWKLRTFRIVPEVFNKRGRTVDVYVGNPVTVEKVRSFTNDEELGRYLYDLTYACKNG